MNLQYLIKYKTFNSVKEMDETVKEHINTHYDQLTESAIEVLYYFASCSLTAIGACHLKGETIAKELSISLATVYRATKKLAELGIITKHKTTKRTGQGASIYVIAPKINTRNDSHTMRESRQSLEIHENAVIPKVHTQKNEYSNNLLITNSFNPFVNKNVSNNVNARGDIEYTNDLRENLKAIYNPNCPQTNANFEELCRVAFNRIKQFMRTHNMPYLQLCDIAIKCMKSLINKRNVDNIFGMYSSMIKNQVLQLFETFIQPVQSFKQSNREIVPDWFENRNNEPVQANKNESIDYEAERAKVLSKLGC